MLVLLISSLTTSAQSIHQIILNIATAPNGYKPYQPFKSVGKTSTSYFYELGRIGSSVSVIFWDKDIPQDYTVMIEQAKVGVSDLTGTPSNRFVKGTSIVSYYQVMDGKFQGACVVYYRDRSLINIYSKIREQTGDSPKCK